MFSNFSDFGYNICSVVREANAAYMVWCIASICTGYLSGKFGAKV